MKVCVNLQDIILILYKVSMSLNRLLRLLGSVGHQSLLSTYFVLRNEKIDTIMKLIDPQSSTPDSNVFSLQ